MLMRATCKFKSRDPAMLCNLQRESISSPHLWMKSPRSGSSTMLPLDGEAGQYGRERSVALTAVWIVSSYSAASDAFCVSSKSQQC